MISHKIDRRTLLSVTAMVLLAGCKAVPSGKGLGTPLPPENPSATILPADIQRHRVALLLPLSGPNAQAGQSLANATTMALLDTNAQNLRITTYDTATGASAAASKAIADGNKLILGPLLSDDIPAVATVARAARMPVVSYSNDEAQAGRNVFVMGTVPSQSILRTVTYARANGANRFAAIVPTGEYGQRVSAAFAQTVRDQGGVLAAMETYDRSANSVAGAVRRLRAKGGFDTVLIADGGRISAQAGPLLKGSGGAGTRILGTELWSGESAVTGTAALSGAWFSAVSDARWRQFSASYNTRFGALPYRIATTGYDSVLLTLRVARDWKPGTTFPTDRLYDPDGFLGLDGAFRFKSNGVIERGLEVREVRARGVTVVSPAPAKFGNLMP